MTDQEQAEAVLEGLSPTGRLCAICYGSSWNWAFRQRNPDGIAMPVCGGCSQRVFKRFRFAVNTADRAIKMLRHMIKIGHEVHGVMELPDDRVRRLLGEAMA